MESSVNGSSTFAPGRGDSSFHQASFLLRLVLLNRRKTVYLKKKKKMIISLKKNCFYLVLAMLGLHFGSWALCCCLGFVQWQVFSKAVESCSLAAEHGL